MPWDPAQYLKFGNERLRPALDLLARVGLESPEVVVDLGCGAGNVTAAIRHRFPAPARIIGVDSSPEMLARARAAEPSVEWVEADVATWAPEAPVDCVYSNATLHWLPDHRSLVTRLMGHLKPGGVLAIQMPNQTSAPSHRGIAEGVEALDLDPAAKAGLHAIQVAPLAGAGDYYDWAMAAGAAHIDQWETVYTHVLGPAPAGSSAVAEWTRSTSMKPVLEALDPARRERFWNDYCARMRAAYPPRADGSTLFHFRRFFMVVTRRA